MRGCQGATGNFPYPLSPVVRVVTPDGGTLDRIHARLPVTVVLAAHEADGFCDVQALGGPRIG